HQSQIEVRVQLSRFVDPASQQWLKECHIHFREAQLQPKQHRKEATDDCPEYPRNQELFADHFMVGGKEIFGYKAIRILVVVVSIMSMVSLHVSYCHNII